MGDDMMLRHACKSYRLGQLVCADGFPQNAACNPKPCLGCGKWPSALPTCQREDLGPTIINPNTGAPVLYRGNAHA